VNCFSFCLVFVALEALLRVSVFLERDRVGGGEGRKRIAEHGYSEQQQREVGNPGGGYRLPILSCERHLA
jgi:hypothetical protein